jgi:hypothetical protein
MLCLGEGQRMTSCTSPHRNILVASLFLIAATALLTRIGFQKHVRSWWRNHIHA